MSLPDHAHWRKLDEHNHRIGALEADAASKEQRMRSMELSMERLHKEIAAGRAEGKTMAEKADKHIGDLSLQFAQTSGEIRGSVRTVIWSIGAGFTATGLVIAASALLLKLFGGG